MISKKKASDVIFDHDEFKYWEVNVLFSGENHCHFIKESEICSLNSMYTFYGKQRCYLSKTILHG